MSFMIGFLSAVINVTPREATPPSQGIMFKARNVPLQNRDLNNHRITATHAFGLNSLFLRLRYFFYNSTCQLTLISYQ